LTQPTLPTADYYIGAVVEFPARTVNGAASTRARIRQFERLLEDAAIRPDIVVFPEDVLNDRETPIVVPTPSDTVVPCGVDAALYDYIISEVSCYARSLQLYLLINVVEVQNCTQSHEIANLIASCAIYNTNVVFDRGGAVISRYRKYNLIGSEWLYFNYTSQPEEEAIFHTDMNVTFGHFTDMDLLYARPAQALVQRGIMDFLHPSNWQSELPFMSAVQLHQSWAYSNNVNLLVAGTNDPRNGRSGSGIYAGKYGALTASMTSDENQSKLHLSVVPKQSVANSTVIQSLRINQNSLKQQQNQTQRDSSSGVLDRFTGVVLARSNDIDLYVTVPIPNEVTNNMALQQQICHNDLCCDFYIKRSVNPLANASTTSYYYRMAAFRGIGSFLNTEPNAVAVCAILSCTGDHIYTCGRIYYESVEVVPQYSFDEVRIRGNFTRGSTSLLTPTSVNQLLMPLTVDEFEWQVQEYSSNISLAKLTLLQPRSDLLTFGIYDNYFLDENHSKDAADTFRWAMWLIPMSFLIQITF
ncbi:vanin-like protein 1, partial [Rhagoletis pomonella]|uniref:vanin-like protein 1 n=1 Tax=Rhagoletis pomonella TaxID=28610 RepID=UPI0017852B05